MAFLEKLNKMAKNIEDKTGDALEISKHTAQKAKEEAAQLLHTFEQLETFDITFNISMDSNELEE